MFYKNICYYDNCFVFRSFYTAIAMRFLIRLFLTGAFLLNANAFAQDSSVGEALQNRTRIVILGDDYMAGRDVAFYQAFPVVLERHLRGRGYGNAQVFNVSKEGVTSADAVEMTQEVLRLNPDLIVLAIGSNDIYDKKTVNSIYYNLIKIITDFRNHNVNVFLIGFKAPDDYEESYTKKLNGMYRYIAQKSNLTLYPDFMDGVASDPRLVGRDTRYPNQRGIKNIVNNIEPYIEKIIYSINYNKG